MNTMNQNHRKENLFICLLNYFIPPSNIIKKEHKLLDFLAYFISFNYCRFYFRAKRFDILLCIVPKIVYIVLK